MATATIDPADLDPTLTELGLTSGLLTPSGTQLAVNTAWFQDPITQIRQMPASPNFVPLIEKILGSVSGNSLGTARKDGNRTWYPISVPADEGPPQPTGLYLVVETIPADGTAGATDATVVGVGTIHTFTEGGIGITPYAYVPVCRLPQNGATFAWALGQQPVELGVAVAAPFQSGGVRFDGATISSTISFDKSPPVGFEIVIQNLKLPGEPAANRSLLDMIEHPDVNEWLKIVASILGAQLTKADPTAGGMIDAVFGLLGLTGGVPSVDWAAVLTNPAQTPALLVAWFQSIAGTPATMLAWLGDWYALFHPGSTGPAPVTGTGSLTDPWRVPLVEIAGAAELQLTLGAFTTPDGSAMQAYPGLAVVSDPVQPIAGLPVRATVEVDAVLLGLTLPTGGGAASVVAFPDFEASVVLANTDPTGKSPLLSVGGNLSLGSVRAGFTLAPPPGGGKPVPVPNARLVNVVTEFGSWPVLDLARFDTQAVETALDTVVQAAVQTLLGIPKGGGTPANPFAANLAAAIGVIPPPSAPSTWPLSPDNMLLSAGELSLLASNPLTALGAYYARALAAGGGSVWQYVLVDIAGLLGGSGTALVNAQATGQPGDPWQVVLRQFGTGSPTPAAYLSAWQPTGTTNELVVALELGVPVPSPVSGVAGVVSVVAEVLHLTLPAGDGTGAVGAEWLTSANVQLRITAAGGGPLATPSLAGVVFGMTDALLTAGWRRGGAFGWAAVAEAVTLTAGSAPPLTVGDIVFGSGPTDWSSQLEQLAPLVIDVLGLLLLEHGGRLGVPLTAALGALPNLPQVVDGSGGSSYPFALPTGIALPAGWPTFQLAHPAAPWLDLQQQATTLLGSPADMVALLRLVGWAITGSVPPAPATTPAGTHDDPWSVLLTNVGNVQPLVWVAGTQAGLGLQRVMTSAAADGVQFDVTLRADVPVFPLAGGSVGAVVPAVALTGLLQSDTAGQPLVCQAATGLTIQSVEIGVSVSLDGTTPRFAPILTFNGAVLATGDSPQTVALAPVAGTPQFTSPQGLQLAGALVNALTSAVTSSGPPQLQAVWQVLDLLSLLQPAGPGGASPPYGVKIDAWQALLADPGSFLTSRVEGVLADPTALGQLYAAAATLLGLPTTSPTPTLRAVGAVLGAIGLLRPVGGGYAIPLSNWLGLVGDPIGYLSGQVEGLFGDAAAVKALVTTLAQLAPPSNPYFSIDPTGTKVTLAVPDDRPLAVGGELALSGGLTLNLNQFAFGLRVSAAFAPLGAALELAYQPTVSTDGSLTGGPVLSLAGTGPLPAPFDPLPLYPIPTDVAGYLARLGTELPIVAVSALLAKAVNAFVLPANTSPTPGQQFAINAFEAFGLTTQADSTKPVQVRPFLGIFLHPVEWLLSPRVLGDNSGRLDLSKLGSILYQVAGTGIQGPGSVSLLPYQYQGGNNGAELSAKLAEGGVQFGVTVAAHAADATGVGIDIGLAVTVAGLTVAVSPGIAFGLGSGVQVDGAVALGFDLGPASDPTATQLAITAGYNQTGTTGFALALSGRANGTAFPNIPLVPFPGLNQLLSGATQALVNILGDRLFAAFTSYQQKNPGSPLVGFVTQLEQATGVTDTTSLVAYVQKLKADPLTPFEPASAPGTVAAILDLLTNTFKLTGFAIDTGNKGLLTYSHAIGTTGAAVTVKAGTRTLGGQAVFGLWVVPAVEASWLRFATGDADGDTGIGVGLPLAATPDVRFAVYAALGVDLAKFPVPALPAGPTLQFGLTGSVSSGLGGYALQLYPAGVGTAATTLLIDLLPTPQLAYGNAPTQPADAGGWLKELAFQLLIPLLSDAILSIQTVAGWLSKDIVTGNDASSAGAILVEWGLLTSPTAGRYALNDLRTEFAGQTPVQIVTGFLAAVLGALRNQTIVPFKGGGISVVYDATSQVYGLGLRLPDVTLSAPAAGPKVVLQLGKWMTTQETNTKNWINGSTGGTSEMSPGLGVYFIQQSGSSYQFAPGVELVSVGLDFDGADAQHPLVNIQGFSVGALSPRVYLKLLDDAGKLDWSFGAAAYCDQIGVPLGPGAVTGSSNNPVAQNLLSGGGSQSGSAGAVNPPFSASAALVYGNTFEFQLYDAKGQPTDDVWVTVQRSFGPVQCNKIGVGWKQLAAHGSCPASPAVEIGFDGSVSLAGLAVDVQGLMVGVPLKSPGQFGCYDLALAGLNVTYQGGPVSISGGFLEVGSGYYGEASIRAASFGVSALGGYDVLDGQPSLFIYAALDAAIGGPAFFFVTGLAAGFGYNRGLILPDQNSVPTFPLVAAVLNPASMPKPPEPLLPDGYQNYLGDVLGKLAAAVPPQLGEYWLAAGVRWTTFDLVNAFALLTVAFGTDFEIALMGVATVAVPNAAGGETAAPVGFAELGLMVSYNATAGVLATTAVLAPTSYVLDPKCHLTGGFAFYFWFKDQPASATGQPGAPAGQFVITLGGYHPDFVAPLRPWYYPDEPRLGFNWQITPEVLFKGGLYFALTPSAVMAGGSLGLTYQSGRLKAWFDAYADFLIMWKPFHYDIRIGISVGASYRVDFLFVHKTFTVELGASVHIWGPPFGGTATVSWWVISFTIDFGASNNTPLPPLSWDQFDQSFLPQPTAASSATRAAALTAAPADSPVVTVRVAGGLLQTLTQQDQPDAWVVAPHGLVFAVDTAIPASGVAFNGTAVAPGFTPAAGLGVRPMRQTSLDTPLTVTISKETGESNGVPVYTPVPAAEFVGTVTAKSVPVALWSGNPPPANGFDPTQVIDNAQGGLQLTPPDPDVGKLNRVGPFPKQLLAFQDAPDRTFDWGDLRPPASPAYPGGIAAVDLLTATVMDKPVAGVRRRTLDALVANGVIVDTGVDLSVMAATAGQVLLSVPVLVGTGGIPSLAATGV